MYFLYVDESGSTGLADRHRTYMSLAGVAIHDTIWPQIETVVANYKLAHFGNADLEIKSSALRRRKPPFDKLSSAGHASALQGLLDLFQTLPVQVFASVVNVPRLDKFVTEWSYPHDDPYARAFFEMIIRYEIFLHEKGEHGIVVLDSRVGHVSPKRGSQDARVRAVHQAFRRSGGQNRNAESTLSDGIIGEAFFVTSAESFGTQLADFAAYAFFQHFESPTTENALFEVLQQKLYLEDKPLGKPFDRILVHPDSFVS